MLPHTDTGQKVHLYRKCGIILIPFYPISLAGLTHGFLSVLYMDVCPDLPVFETTGQKYVYLNRQEW